MQEPEPEPEQEPGQEPLPAQEPERWPAARWVHRPLQSDRFDLEHRHG